MEIGDEVSQSGNLLKQWRRKMLDFFEGADSMLTLNDIHMLIATSVFFFFFEGGGRGKGGYIPSSLP